MISHFGMALEELLLCSTRLDLVRACLIDFVGGSCMTTRGSRNVLAFQPSWLISHRCKRKCKNILYGPSAWGPEQHKASVHFPSLFNQSFTIDQKLYLALYSNSIYSYCCSTMDSSPLNPEGY